MDAMAHGAACQTLANGGSQCLAVIGQMDVRQLPGLVVTQHLDPGCRMQFGDNCLVNPGDGIETQRRFEPHEDRRQFTGFSSSLPTAAARATAEGLCRAASIICGAMMWPPRMISSLLPG